jgi:hypothetical protein
VTLNQQKTARHLVTQMAWSPDHTTPRVVQYDMKANIVPSTHDTTITHLQTYVYKTPSTNSIMVGTDYLLALLSFETKTSF